MASRRAPAGLAALVLAALLGGACGSSNVSAQIDAPLPPNLERCEDKYEDGKVIDYSADGDFGKACEENGDLVTPVPIDVQCTDGRRLLSNRYAWGYQGDVMTLFASEDDTVRLPPDDEVSRCLEQVEEPEEGA